jgi:hypothetical protein
MGVIINVTLLVLGTTGALAAFGGDTWRRDSGPLTRRITRRGWLALLCLLATLGVGIAKEIRTSRQAEESAKKEEQLRGQLSAANTALGKASENLERTKTTLEGTRTKLAAVEPSILEGIILATSGIRRESEFTTPHLQGEHSLRLISGRNAPEPLQIYGGDYLEYHIFCSDNGRRQSGFPLRTSPRTRGGPDSLSLRVGDTSYPLGTEGRHMIIGPIGVPMTATLLNPEGLRDCWVKILIESADRTRVAKQLSPLVEAIKAARKDSAR